MSAASQWVRRVTGAVLLAVGLTVVLRSAGSWAADAKPASPAVARDTVGLAAGYRLPGFSATDLNGQTHEFSQYKGQILILHFWASWCPYCRGEVSKLTQVTKELTSKGVRVLAVSSDEEVEQLKAFVAEQQLPYPVVADVQSEASLFDQYGISGIPVTFIVARDGHTAFRLNGSSDIVGAVQSLLQ